MRFERITHEILDENFHLLSSDPSRYLDMTEQLVAQNPNDALAYFSRYQVLARLGSYDRALADLDRCLSLRFKASTFEARGELLRRMGRYGDAIKDFDASEAMDSEEWRGGFGALYRADCYARLGDVEKALEDCATLREDHWTPGHFDLPAGTKADVIRAVKYTAALARQAARRG